MKTKKIINITALLIIMVLSLLLCGCGLTLTEPEDTVTDFFSGLKAKNEDTLILYTKNEDINMLLHSKGDKEELDKMYDSIFRNFSYKILSVKKNKDETKAIVTAEVSNGDFSKVLKNYQEKAYNYMQDNLYSGKLDRKTLNAKCLAMFTKQVEKASSKEKIQTETMEINVTKNDNYGWDMELTEEMMEIIMGGLIIPL